MIGIQHIPDAPNALNPVTEMMLAAIFYRIGLRERLSLVIRDDIVPPQSTFTERGAQDPPAGLARVSVRSKGGIECLTQGGIAEGLEKALHGAPPRARAGGRSRRRAR